MRIIILFSVFFSLLGCTSSTPESSSSPSTQYLTVLHTNDNHGRFWQNEKGEYGMAARKTLIDSLRNESINVLRAAMR